MPEIKQYSFTLREVGSALLKSAGISEGKWALGVNFNINVGNMGTSPTQSLPAVMLQVQSLNIAKAPPGAEIGENIIDASEIK